MIQLKDLMSNYFVQIMKWFTINNYLINIYIILYFTPVCEIFCIVRMNQNLSDEINRIS